MSKADCRSATRSPSSVATSVTARLAVIAVSRPPWRPPPRAVPWSAPRSVTVSGAAREPVVALGGPDAAAVAYVRRLDGVDRLELRQGTIQTLPAPMIVDRDARHGLDSPALTHSGHVALVAWRRFRDPDTRVLELASVSRGRVVQRAAGDHRAAERLTAPPSPTRSC